MTATRTRRGSAGRAVTLAVTVTAAALLATGCGTPDGEDARPGTSRGGADAASPSGGGSESPAASGAPALSWSYDRVLDGDASLADMAVVAEDDIWAYGTGRGPTGGTNDQYLLHYDGTRWRERPLPGVLGSEPGTVRLDAVGSGQVWLTATGAAQDQPRVARWDGHRWSALPRPPAGRVADVEAFAPDDVRMLAGEDQVLRWDGRRWTATRLPASVESLDGTAPDDLWAVGFRRTGSETGELTQPATVHFDGHSWRLVETPAYHFAEPVPPEPDATLDHVFALAPDDVRVYGTHTFNHGEGEDEPDDERIRLRWDGTAWRDQPSLPGECGGRIPVARDGDAGLVLDGNWYVTTDGACAKIKRSRLPERGGVTKESHQSLWLEEVAPVPGTDEIIGVGHVQVNQSGNPMAKAVIVSLKR
ncbi:hypothetical protein ACFY93_01585 [Streptomyces sp. NPDC008313]|uniref:hypothetical protein n=1 Tax=Streptomyces sp. NPDC008313 TaxID=3364826 RepID=UPI0036E56A77